MAVKPKIKGQVVGSMKKLKDALKSGFAGIQNIPKNGALRVRFITEPDEWVAYREGYDEMLRAYFPLTEDDGPSGTGFDGRVSKRFLANAIDLDKNEVIALKLPADLANRLYLRAEKRGTITDRDWELTRDGEGINTVYDASPEAPSKLNLKKYQELDLMQALSDQWQSVFGTSDDEDEDDEDEAPKKKKAPAKKAAAAKKAPGRRRAAPVDDDEDDDDDVDDEEDEEEEEVEDDDDFDEEEDEEGDEEDEEEEEVEDDDEEEADEDDEEEVYLSEEDLQAMDLDELKEVADDMEITYSTRAKKPGLIKLILEAAEEDDE